MRQLNQRRVWATALSLALAGAVAPAPSFAQGCDAPEAATHLSAARTHMAAGRYREAINEFNRAILAGPQCDEAKQGVVEANRALLERQAGAGSTQATINRHISLGGTAFDAGDFERAITEWEAALALDPENKVAKTLIDSARAAQVDQLIEEGSRLFAAGATDAAMQAWEHARELDPHNHTLAALLNEGRQQQYREEEAQLDSDLQDSIHRMRAALEKARQLPTPDTTGAGERYRDASERPEFPSLIEERGAGRIMTELRNPVSLDFEDTDLRAVLKFLSEVTGINFLVDEEVFEQLGEADPDDPQGGKRIPISIFVTDLPLESALKGMLRQRGLDFSIERDFIYVSTPELLRASSFEQMEVRFYKLRDASRITLPKLEARAARTSALPGTQAVDAASGGELLTRVNDLDSDQVAEAEAAPVDFTVARLMAILRNFVPEVVEAGPQTGQRRQAATSEDRVLGGWSRVQTTADMQTRMHRITRERRWDADRREILSRLDYDASTHTLIAKNTPSNLDLLERMLDSLDRPNRQVQIEARFLDVSMDDIHRVNTDLDIFTVDRDAASSQLGVTNVGPGGTSLLDNLLVAAIGSAGLGLGFGGDLTVSGLGSGASDSFGQQFTFGFQTDDNNVVQAAIDLLTQLQHTETISAPKLTTMSGKPAVLQDVTTNTFVTDVDANTRVIQPPVGSSNVQPIVLTELNLTFTVITTGITLSVTPMVLDQDTVRMWLSPDVSSPGPGSQLAIPIPDVNNPDRTFTVDLIEIARQSLFTNVTVHSGDTLILGGLIRQDNEFTERSTPFFRDIPLIGNFFRSTGQATERRQLLIFVRPLVMSEEGIAYVRMK